VAWPGVEEGTLVGAVGGGLVSDSEGTVLGLGDGVWLGVKDGVGVRVGEGVLLELGERKGVDVGEGVRLGVKEGANVGLGDSACFGVREVAPARPAPVPVPEPVAHEQTRPNINTTRRTFVQILIRNLIKPPWESQIYPITASTAVSNPTAGTVAAIIPAKGDGVISLTSSSMVPAATNRPDRFC
jgi:hypothetical protein